MKITIIGGAGTLGSCTAFTLATQGLAEEIVMIDINQNLLMCHAMDINTAIVGQRDILVRAGNDEDMSRSDVVIMTASVPYRDITSQRDMLYEHIPIIRDIAKKIERFCPDAVVLTTTNPVDSLNYTMYLSSTLDCKKLIGYSLNDSIRFRMAIAKTLGVKSTQVEGVAMGEHVETLAMLFSSIRVNGQPISVDEDLKQRLREEVPNILRSYINLGTGRTAGWTSAVGLSAMVRAIGADARQMFPCSAVLAGEYGCEGLSMSVPALLGRAGIHQILEWELPPDEQKELEHAATVLKSAAQVVEEAVGPDHR